LEPLFIALSVVAVDETFTGEPDFSWARATLGATSETATVSAANALTGPKRFEGWDGLDGLDGCKNTACSY
jgi:hypothetical protein